MKKVTFGFMMSFGILFAAVKLQAADHPHEKGPHGGIVHEFTDKTHIEAVKSGGNVTFYVLDGEAKAGGSVAKHQGGNVTVLSPGKKMEKTSIAAGTNFSEFSVKAPEGKITTVITLKADGKNASAKFNLKD